MKKTIWGNTIVKNEDRFIWFAISSVIRYLDKILVWDTGSSDSTVKLIQSLQRKYPKKITFKELGELDPKGLTGARQRMLKQSQCDWILIVDGDEVWWKDSIEKVVSIIEKEGDNLYAIVIPVINLIGDIYHYQEESAGQYKILGRKGHFNIRAVNRKVPGLHIKNDYPLEAFYDKDERVLQRIENKLQFVEAPYLHFTHLPRSTIQTNKQSLLLRSRKLKYEMGIPFPKKFKYPEVFYKEYPTIVPSPWVKRSTLYTLRAAIETPFKKLKRKVYL